MSRLEQLALAIAPQWLIGAASRAKASARHTAASRTYGPLVGELVADATHHELLVANDHAVVIRVFRADKPPQILKIGTSSIADEQIANEAAALDELNQHSGLGVWSSLVSQVDDRGEHAGGTWFTQSSLSGLPTSELDTEPHVLVESAIDAITPLHRVTSVTTMADDDVLDELVSDPIESIRTWRPALADELAVINGEARQRLASLELVVCRQHGDYGPSNVLWDADREAVSGIVDWRLAAGLLPPEVDAMHYALSLLMLRRRGEYGHVVISLLGDGETLPAASPARRVVERGPNDFGLRTAVTLAWLQHVSFGLQKAPDVRTSPIWLTNNIDHVVRALHPTA